MRILEEITSSLFLLLGGSLLLSESSEQARPRLMSVVFDTLFDDNTGFALWMISGRCPITAYGIGMMLHIVRWKN